MLPITGGRSSLHKTLAVSLIILAMLIIFVACTAQVKAAQTGDLLYVCNANNVTAFNASDLSAVKALNFNNTISPGYIALSPGGTTAYIVSASDDRLLVVDIARAKITHITTLTAPAGKPRAACSAIAVSPDGKRIYINDNEGGLLRVVDSASYEVIANISVGSYPIGLALSTDGRYAYVANSGSGTVSVIDTPSNKVIGTITGGNGTFGVQLSPDGSRLYVSNWYGGDVTVYNAYSGAELGKIRVNPWISHDEGGIGNMRVSPDGKTLYVANAYDNTIVLINTNTKSVYKTIPVGQFPKEMELSKNGGQLFVSLIGDHKICSISLPSGNVTYLNMPASTPAGMAYFSSYVIPTPVPGNAVSATPVPTPSFAPTPRSAPTPQPTINVPITYYITGIGKSTPTPKPGGTGVPEVTIRPYFTGWEAPDIGINLSDENTLLAIVGGLLLFLIVVGTIAYLSVRRKLRGPGEDEDEYEYEDD